MKATKTPSGKYKVRVYDYTDENKKKHYKAFTADTKKEAELMALSYQHNANETNLTFYEALKSYIDSRESVIAPSTLREYRRSLENDFDMIKDKNIEKITQEDVQRLINEHAKTKKPKTVKNIHGLISSTFRMYRPSFKLHTTLPQKDVNNAYIPTDDDIRKIMDIAKDDRDMYIAILLAAFGPMRRSEICGLKDTDIKGNIAHVKRAVVNSEHGYVEKKTKSAAGDRLIPLPDFVIDEIKGIKGNIINLKPNQVSDRFIDIVNESGLEHFTFHSLRHYCASILHTMGVPDVYIMERGGWNSDAVLKQIYRHALSDQSNALNNMANMKFAEKFGQK